MPRVNGIEATRRIVTGPEPRAHVLVLTTFDLDEYVYDARRAGASGFLLKDAPEDHLVSSFRVVAEGGSLLDPAVTRRLIEQFVMRGPATPPTGLEELTVLDHYVQSARAEGCSWTEIGAALGVTKQAAHERFVDAPLAWPTNFNEPARRLRDITRTSPPRPSRSSSVRTSPRR
jgi:DNA-binding NarL/FixJ family response regulator